MMSHVITSSARMYGSWWRQSVTYYQSVQILDIFTTKVYEFWVFLWNCTNIGRPSPFIRDHHTFISSSWGRIVGLMGLVCINDCIHGNLYSEFHAISFDTTHDISQTSLSRSIRLKLTVSKNSMSATFFLRYLGSGIYFMRCSTWSKYETDTMWDRFPPQGNLQNA